jgi:hypothetical protein
MTEFDDVIQRLEADRPQVTDRELDAIKQRVRRRAADPSRRSQSMKSRFAILAMLVTGMLFSTAGAGLALSGGGKNASVQQYAECTPTPAPTTTGGGGTVGGSEQNGTVGGENCEEGGVLPAEETHPGSGTKNNTSPSEEESNVSPAEETGGTTTTQPERQAAAAATTSQLPFTGFAAIPVLIGGLALLTGGLILRRRTS